MSTFEALRVANALEVFNVQLFYLETEREVVKASIDMIRRLYARVQELEAAQAQCAPLLGVFCFVFNTGCIYD
jgi:hypothetical protein